MLKGFRGYKPLQSLSAPPSNRKGGVTDGFSSPEGFASHFRNETAIRAIQLQMPVAAANEEVSNAQVTRLFSSYSGFSLKSSLAAPVAAKEVAAAVASNRCDCGAISSR